MNTSTVDTVFAGSIPQLYDTHMVPLIFAPFAADLAARLAGRPMRRLLEIAAGTGVVTRALAQVLPASVEIVATDLNPAMLAEAARIGTPRPVTWQPADVMQLPFEDASFDAVVCQFGVMFFPDKAAAHAQMLRVLRPGGLLLFNVWDEIAANEFAAVVTDTLAARLPADPPRFLARTPHGYSDRATILRDLATGGFTQPASFETVAARSRADDARIPAVAYCQGTPLRSEIEARGLPLAEATTLVARAIAQRFGTGPVDGLIRAHVVAALRPG